MAWIWIATTRRYWYFWRKSRIRAILAIVVTAARARRKEEEIASLRGECRVKEEEEPVWAHVASSQRSRSWQKPPVEWSWSWREEESWIVMDWDVSIIQSEYEPVWMWAWFQAVTLRSPFIRYIVVVVRVGLGGCRSTTGVGRWD